MNLNQLTALGVMSGTSLDGIDLALCTFKKEDGWSFKIKKTAVIPYGKEWKKQLAEAHLLPGFDLLLLQNSFTRYTSSQIKEFLRTEDQVELIGIHGHTIFHQPEKAMTTQILNGEMLAVETGIPCVCDFRSKDIALGGQGAPLVPIGDELLFSNYDYCLNLGGIANISTNSNTSRIAFDICPANMALNYFAQKLGKEYDRNGEFAKAGLVQKPLLAELNQLPYYGKQAPKSLGREWFETEFLPLIHKFEYAPGDILASLTEHIATQVCLGLENDAGLNMLCTGGGAKNQHLVELIKSKTQTKVTLPDEEIIEFKEAIIFAFLAVLRWRNEINCLGSVTGAARDSCGGVVHLPN